ncbi:MAG TPA: VacJ family lipoprotein [Steroidobacteraceae bacterium]
MTLPSRAGLLAGVVMLALSGCATEGVSVRRLPAETPAADNAAAVKRAEEFAAAQKATATQAAQASAGVADAKAAAPAANTTTDGEPPLAPLTPAEAPSMYSYDPWERLNRFTYRFNARFDDHVFLPVANGYRRVPGPIRGGVHNFFRNLAEVTSTVNYGLQWRLGSGARSLGRFVINSTIGIGGLFDVASKLKLSNEQTGFGATLSTWGVHPGPYVVLPLLGPSTLRDGFGLLGDYGVEYGVNVVNLYRGYKTYPLGVVNAIDQRAAIDFRYYGSASPFEYETIRFLYVHRDLIQDEALRARGRHKPQNPTAPAGK